MYISPSQIIETGYTQGDILVITYNQQLYKGFYHKDNQERYWSGKDHTETSMLLSYLPPTTSEITLNTTAKDNSISYPFSKRFDYDLDTPLLNSNFILPNESNYDKGFFVRYFAQLKNSTQLYIVEVNYNTYNTFLTNKNITNHYIIAALLWQLTGPINDIYNNNIRTIPGIKDTNLRSIQDAEKTFPGLSLYLTDPLQFARVTK